MKPVRGSACAHTRAHNDDVWTCHEKGSPDLLSVENQTEELFKIDSQSLQIL
jgi:hypothetical protein